MSTGLNTTSAILQQFETSAALQQGAADISLRFPRVVSPCWGSRFRSVFWVFAGEEKRNLDRRFFRSGSQQYNTCRHVACVPRQDALLSATKGGEDGIGRTLSDEGTGRGEDKKPLPVTKMEWGICSIKCPLRVNTTLARWKASEVPPD